MVNQRRKMEGQSPLCTLESSDPSILLPAGLGVRALASGVLLAEDVIVRQARGCSVVLERRSMHDC